MTITIKNRHSDTTIYVSQTAETIREAVEEAVKAKVSLYDADLTGANLSGADLSGAYLMSADLHEANLFAANLSGADLFIADLYDADLTGANLSGADLTGASLRDANLTGANLINTHLRDTDLAGIIYDAPVPTVPQIHQAVLKAVTTEGCRLDMGDWHVCATTHCRAGWVVHLAGEAGRELEDKVGTPLAAALIYRVSDPAMTKRPDFYCDDDEAMKSIREAAEREAAETNV